MMLRLLARLVLLIALSATASPVFASDSVLAVSAAHKATVSAEGGEGWCSASILLRMSLQADSPDIGNVAAQLALLNRLGPIISRTCPLAASATVTVSSGGLMLGTFSGRAAVGWRFAASGGAGGMQVVPRKRLDLPPPEAPRVAAERDYAGALLAFLQQRPALAGDTQVLKYWSALKHPRAFQQANGQEFRLQPLLEQAQSELAHAIASAPPRQVTFTMKVQFGAYDFKQQRFPFLQSFDGVTMNRPCCAFGDPLPAYFRISITDAASLASLPMAPDAASQFLETRTNRFGNVDRQLLLVITVQLASGGFGPDQNAPQGTGELRQVLVLGTQPPQTEVARLDATKFAALREAGAAKAVSAAAAAARAASAQQEALARQQADQQRQILLDQRATLLNELQSASLSVRLANYAAEGASVNAYAHLNDLRDSRAAAAFSGRPVEATMLIHPDASGRRAISTSWPGSLVIEVPPALPRLASGAWYLVRGTLAVPKADEAGDDVQPAILEARAIISCQQQDCADLAEPSAILNHKLAAAAPSLP